LPIVSEYALAIEMQYDADSTLFI